jgi:hypothetical protein
MKSEKINNIGIITTVNNFDLYNRTVAFFPECYKIFVIDGSDGLFGLNSFKFMFKKLKKQNLKWLVLVDEDVVFVNPDSVLNIVKLLEENNEDVCGVRDGGILSWRDKNPNLINPFFCILNLEKIYTIYDEQEFLRHQYILKDEFDDDLSDLLFGYDKESLFESYYCFFLWLRRNDFKFKFLDARGNDFENDLETTTVFDTNNKVLLYHSWYARSYGYNKYHTARIERVIREGNHIKEYNKRAVIWYVDYRFKFYKLIMKPYKVLIKFIKK